MSADNGIYILVSPIKDGGKEYRVADCQAIENIVFKPDLGDEMTDLWYEVGYFGNCVVFKTEEEALKEAVKLLRESYICEYGISFIERDHEFPQISIEEANQKIEKWWNEYHARSFF